MRLGRSDTFPVSPRSCGLKGLALDDEGNVYLAGDIGGDSALIIK